MARGEERTGAAEDHDADLVVGLGLEERVVEVDEEPPALRVPALGTVQHDPGDRAVVQRLVGDVLVLPHGALLFMDPHRRATTVGLDALAGATRYAESRPRRKNRATPFSGGVAAMV